MHQPPQPLPPAFSQEVHPMATLMAATLMATMATPTATTAILTGIPMEITGIPMEIPMVWDPGTQKKWFYQVGERCNGLVWSNYSDLTRPISPKWWFTKGIPLISGKSRLVKYYLVEHAAHFYFLSNKKPPPA